MLLVMASKRMWQAYGRFPDLEDYIKDPVFFKAMCREEECMWELNDVAVDNGKLIDWTIVKTIILEKGRSDREAGMTNAIKMANRLLRFNRDAERLLDIGDRKKTRREAYNPHEKFAADGSLPTK